MKADKQTGVNMFCTSKPIVNVSMRDNLVAVSFICRTIKSSEGLDNKRSTDVGTNCINCHMIRQRTPLRATSRRVRPQHVLRGGKCAFSTMLDNTVNYPSVRTHTHLIAAIPGWKTSCKKNLLDVLTRHTARVNHKKDVKSM